MMMLMMMMINTIAVPANYSYNNMHAHTYSDQVDVENQVLLFEDLHVTVPAFE